MGSAPDTHPCPRGRIHLEALPHRIGTSTGTATRPAPGCRVGGIAATCAEAFRPYRAVLADLNLVTNAITFTPPGGSIRVAPSTSGSAVVLSVSATGIGIPPAEQEAVFGRFVRGAECSQDVIPGTGLGLAIVLAIVEHHGGPLGLASSPGRGTTIRVRLPSPASAEAEDERIAQGAGGSADKEPKALMPIGVAAPGAGAPAQVSGEQSERHSKEHPR